MAIKFSVFTQEGGLGIWELEGRFSIVGYWTYPVPVYTFWFLYSSSRQHKTQCNAYRCTMVYITKRPMFLITARGRTLNLSLAIQRGRSGRQTTLWAQFQRVGYNRTIWIGAVGRSTTSSFSNSHISYLVEAINCVESSAITLNPSS